MRIECTGARAVVEPGTDQSGALRSPSWKELKKSMRLAPVVLLSALLPTVAAASTYSGVTAGAACATSQFVTCASVRVQYLELGETTGPVLSIRGSGVSEATQPETPASGYRFSPMFGQGITSGSVTTPQILAIFRDDDGRQWECRPGGLDCRAVTTPEPVTMTLVATGLMGLVGAGRLRRRRPG